MRITVILIISLFTSNHSGSYAESEVSCDFEVNTCGWTQDKTDDFDWTRHKGETPTTDTGPSGGHAVAPDKTDCSAYGENVCNEYPSWASENCASFCAVRQGHYLFIESSSPRMLNETARLLSPDMSPTTTHKKCFEFWYHMFDGKSKIGEPCVDTIQNCKAYGTGSCEEYAGWASTNCPQFCGFCKQAPPETAGRLKVYVKPQGVAISDVTPLVTKVGNKNNTWHREYIRLPTAYDFQIVIEAVRGVTFYMDIALDNFKLIDCPYEPTTQSLVTTQGTTKALTTVTDPPTTIADPPTTVTEPPTTKSYLLTTATDPPTTVTNPPTTVTDPPSTVTDLPTTVTDPPTTVTDPPTTVTDSPTTVKEPLTTATEPPTSVADTPTTVRDTTEPLATTEDTIGNTETTTAVELTTQNATSPPIQRVTVKQFPTTIETQGITTTMGITTTEMGISVTKKATEISTVRPNDTAIYNATAYVAATTATSADTTELSSRKLTTPENSEEVDNSGLIVGIVLGTFSFLLILALVAWCLLRRRNKTQTIKPVDTKKVSISKTEEPVNKCCDNKPDVIVNVSGNSYAQVTHS